jgi:acetylornithine/succinyldiaminopimelate/putrescine aminotransferase
LTKRTDIAGVILEPIMVNAGAYIFTPSYLKLLRKLCNQHHLSLIFDEIQTGFGWTGAMLYSTKIKVTPDLVTLGKSLSPGFPLSAVVMKPEYDILDYGLDEFTYGAHQLSLVVSLATTTYLLENKLYLQAENKGAYLESKLHQLQQKHPHIKAIRRCGLIIGITFPNNQTANSIYDRCLQEGLILRKSKDNLGESLVFKPALITTKTDINQAVSIFDHVLSHT